MQYYIEDNKLLLIIDAVKFTNNEFDLSVLKDKDYRIIFTHGITGELLDMIGKKYHNLNKNKLIFCINNIEAQMVMNKNGARCANISEYVFLNDDLYDIINLEKEYDSIFAGRRSKLTGLSIHTYKSKIKQHIVSEPSEVDASKIKFEYNKALSGIMTTEAEGSCRAVAEMLLCGLPIVSVKIPTLDREKYYPYIGPGMYGAYTIVLPNTLGGRELWLDDYNSIICERNDNSLDYAIQSIIEKKIPGEIIRRDFLNKLFTERIKFLFLLKSVTEELDVNISNVKLHSFINFCCGNYSTTTKEWQKTINYFKTLFI